MVTNVNRSLGQFHRRFADLVIRGVDRWMSEHPSQVGYYGLILAPTRLRISLLEKIPKDLRERLIIQSPSLDLPRVQLFQAWAPALPREDRLADVLKLLNPAFMKFGVADNVNDFGRLIIKARNAEPYTRAPSTESMGLSDALDREGSDDDLDEVGGDDDLDQGISEVAADAMDGPILTTGAPSDRVHDPVDYVRKFLGKNVMRADGRVGLVTEVKYGSNGTVLCTVIPQPETWSVDGLEELGTSLLTEPLAPSMVIRVK